MKGTMRRSYLAVGLGVALTGACLDDGSLGTGAEADFVHASGGAVRAYDVTITNLTTGQPFSPGVLATHSKDAALFHVGSPASNGIRLIAEDGNQAPALAELTSRPGVICCVTRSGPGCTAVTRVQCPSRSTQPERGRQ